MRDGGGTERGMEGWRREGAGGMERGMGGMPMERGVEIEGWDGEEKEREMSTSIFLIMA